MRFCYFGNVGQVRESQNFQRSKAEQAAITEKRKEVQTERPDVKCEGKNLENIFLFKYLGSVFAADGSHDHDVTGA